MVINLMWRKKYHDLYFHDTRDIKSQAEASILKDENFPEILFKYMKSEYAIGSLKDDFIKVSDPFHVNDPFEGEMLFDYEMISQQYKDDLLIRQMDNPVFNLSSEDKNRIVNSENPLDSLIDIVYHNDSKWGEGITIDEFKLEFVEIFDEFAQYKVKNYNHELKKQMLFVCLSESDNIIPMWAHYTDNHRGVCIGYDLKDFELGCEETCHPVLYVHNSDFTEDINNINNDERNKLKVLEEPFLRKSHDWSYEKEWRILIDKMKLKQALKLGFSSVMDKRGDLCFIKFPKPVSVFLGLDISDDCEQEIMEICEDRGITVYKMIKDSSRYNLDYIEI